MESQLYMRVRGRVLGPYDHERLQGLARRGQLSRMHELSSDGVSWVRASNYPELFTGGQAELPTLPSDGANSLPPDSFGGGSSTLTPPQAQAPGAAAGSKWYYTAGGEQRGPVDFANLQMLAGLGQLGPQDQVWAEGMVSWVPAAHVHGLIKGADSGSSATAEAAASRVPEGLRRSAADSRGWALFISFVMYLYAIASAGFGILILIVGSREREAGAVAYGIAALLHAMIVIFGGALLSTYASRLGKLRYTSDPIILERALEALRNFWIYISMYLVVWLSLIVIVAIAVFAVGVTLPRVPL
jgi:hypothetical protein